MIMQESKDTDVQILKKIVRPNLTTDIQLITKKFTYIHFEKALLTLLEKIRLS